MAGCVYALKGEHSKNAELVTEKQLRLASELQDLIERFPEDPTSDDLQDRLLRIRNRFKLLTASAKFLQQVGTPKTQSFDF
jgi:hypothetical protein